MLRRSEREPLLRLGVGQRKAREGMESRAPLHRIHEQILTRRRFLSHAARDFEMMGRIRPGAFDLSVDGRLLIGDDDRVGGKQLEEVAAARSRGSGRLELFGFHREDSHPTQDLAGPLRVQVEAAHRRNLVAPPFDPRGRRHPEAIHVENAAPDAVLRDFRHCRHTRVPHPNQSLRDRLLASLLTSMTRRACSSAAGTAVRSAVARAVVIRTRTAPRSSASIVSMRSPASS